MKTNLRFTTIMIVIVMPLFLLTEARGATYTYESQDIPKNIPDYSTTYLYLGKPASFVDKYATTLSSLNVPDSFIIHDVDVVLNINHTWDTDLDVYLMAPDGTKVELFTDVGGSGDNFTETQLDDEASTSITASSAPFTGSFKPEGNLSILDGKNAQGTWILIITDDAMWDLGSLLSWRLVIDIGPAPAETRLVPADYATIQQAINDSNDGDVVIVAPDTYQENINFLGKDIVVTSTDPNDPEVVATTIIRPRLKDRGNVSSIGSAVTFENGESSEAVLTGFTITRGYGTANPVLGEGVIWGAGIYCVNSSPTIMCNVITGNNAPVETGFGGGIGCINSDAIIVRNIIKNNSAYAGAGIMTYMGDSKICNNLIYDNSALIGGGAIIFGGRLINNTIVDNDASLAGQEGLVGNLYAVYEPDFYPTFIWNNLICRAESGGGVYLEGNFDDSSFAFNDVWGNLPGNYLGIDMNTGDSIYDGSVDRTGDGGNISRNPCFKEDYRIGFYSPCCEAGDPNYVAYLWQRDIDGEYAVMGARIDIGADEVTANARPVADAGPDQYFDTIVAYVVLDGTNSYDPDASGITSYQWRQVDGPNVALVNPDTPESGFVPVGVGIYVFELVVSDENSDSIPDSVMIVVGNRAPVANAGDDRSCEPGQQVILNGSRSYDLDVGDVLSYNWSQVSGPSVELVDPNTQSPSFTPEVEGEYVFELIVNDGTDQSLPDTVIITCRIGSELDAYGYWWIDSDSSWGPEYNWIDIQETGTTISGLEYTFEEYVGPFPLGFDFDFYGNTYNQFYVQSNGLISFGPDVIIYDNQPIPAADGYDNIIAWMWTYMYPSDVSKVYYQQLRSYTVIQFVDYAIGYGGSVNAEVIIYKSGKIVIQFKDFSDDAYLGLYTIGIENADGSIGTQVAFNDFYYLHNELMIEFSLGPREEPAADAGDPNSE